MLDCNWTLNPEESFLCFVRTWLLLTSQKEREPLRLHSFGTVSESKLLYRAATMQILPYWRPLRLPCGESNSGLEDEHALRHAAEQIFLIFFTRTLVSKERNHLTANAVTITIVCCLPCFYLMSRNLLLMRTAVYKFAKLPHYYYYYYYYFICYFERSLVAVIKLLWETTSTAVVASAFSQQQSNAASSKHCVLLE